MFFFWPVTIPFLIFFLFVTVYLGEIVVEKVYFVECSFANVEVNIFVIFRFIFFFFSIKNKYVVERAAMRKYKKFEGEDNFLKS